MSEMKYPENRGHVDGAWLLNDPESAVRIDNLAWPIYMVAKYGSHAPVAAGPQVSSEVQAGNAAKLPLGNAAAEPAPGEALPETPAGSAAKPQSRRRRLGSAAAIIATAALAAGAASAIGGHVGPDGRPLHSYEVTGNSELKKQLTAAMQDPAAQRVMGLCAPELEAEGRLQDHLRTYGGGSRLAISGFEVADIKKAARIAGEHDVPCEPSSPGTGTYLVAGTFVTESVFTHFDVNSVCEEYRADQSMVVFDSRLAYLQRLRSDLMRQAGISCPPR